MLRIYKKAAIETKKIETKKFKYFWRTENLDKMFLLSTGERGLVCKYDVVCFDEVSGVSFDQKDGVNIMKGYMEN